MKKLLIILIINLFFFVIQANENKDKIITAYKVTDISPEILSRIIEIIDTIHSVDNKNTIDALHRKKNFLDANDSISAKKVYINTYDPYKGQMFVVVNNCFEGGNHADKLNNIDENGISIHFLSNQCLSDRIYRQRLWSENHVRKFGYIDVKGYKVLCVDLDTGTDYFEVSPKINGGIREFKLKWYPYPTKNTNEISVDYIEGWYKFIYRFKEGNLKPIWELKPIEMMMY